MKFAALLPAFLALAACTVPKDDAVRVVESHGFSDVTLHGHAWIGCGRDDSMSIKFKAKDHRNQKVSGVVCGGWGLFGKSYTVRVS